MPELYFPPPYSNGYATLRFKALMQAMRESKLSATEVEITTRADSLLYDRFRLIVRPDGSAIKDRKWNNPDRRRESRLRRKG